MLWRFFLIYVKKELTCYSEEPLQERRLVPLTRHFEFLNLAGQVGLWARMRHIMTVEETSLALSVSSATSRNARWRKRNFVNRKNVTVLSSIGCWMECTVARTKADLST